MFGPSRFRNRKLPPLPSRPKPTVPSVASTHLDKTMRLPPIAVSISASTGQTGEFVCFYRRAQYTDITRLTDPLTLPSLASLGLPRRSPGEISEQDRPSITLPYWPYEDDTYTVRADDQLTNDTCTLTITWTDQNETVQVPIPSGTGLIDFQCQLRAEVDTQLSRLANSEHLRNMSKKDLTTFHRVLWLRYRDATVKSVTIRTRVVSLARGGDSSEEGQLVNIVLPAGYSYRPDGLVKGVKQHLERMGYALRSVDAFRVAYVETCQKQRERYRGLADGSLARE